MHTLLYLDGSFQPLRSLHLWLDTSSEFAFNSLDKDFKTYIKENTGTPLHSMTPLSKLLKNKDSFTYISDLKAYLMYHLTNTFITDIANASSMGLLNMFDKTWDEKILSFLQIKKEQLPQITEINRTFKYKDINVNILIGASDGVLANRGIAGENEFVISAGTSKGIRKLTQNIINNNNFCYCAGFDLLLMGHASNNVGNILNYIQKEISKDISYEEITKILLDSNDYEFCIPYVFGERGPFWQDGLHAFFEDNMSPQAKIKALVFGVFTNASVMLDDLKFKDGKVYLTGGLFSNPRLREIFANFMEKDLYYYEEDAAVHYGLLSLFDINIEKEKVQLHRYKEDVF